MATILAANDSDFRATSIRRRVERGGIVLGLCVVAAFVIAGFGIERIRFGGPIHQQNALLSDLTSDILPPPEYVIEAYLEATQLTIHPESLAQRKGRLADLEKQFVDREEYWKSSDLDPAVKSLLITGSGATGHEFWQRIDTAFLPAVGRGDKAAADLAYGQVTESYIRHRRGIDSLLAAANAQQAQVAQTSFITLVAIVAILLALGAVILTMIIWSLRTINHQVVAPLGRISGQLEDMTNGNFSVTLDEPVGNDEVAALQRAAIAFRDTGMARAASEVQQTRVVNALAQALDAIAAGDLAHAIVEPFAASYDRLRTTFNHSTERLSDLIGGVMTSAERVAIGADEIRSASDDLSRRNNQQAASVEEWAAALAHVNTVVSQTAREAREVHKSIAETHLEAADGAEVVGRTVSAMAGIQSSAQEINQIIGVIDGIAFQTNLLALNAGVEAARAGESGRGFAVVANEVRALAQRSAEAANDIKQLINSSGQQVATGVALVGETGDLLAKIVGKVALVNANIRQIADSAEQQAANIEQISTGVTAMDRLTQENAAMVEQSTAAARSLVNESTSLKGAAQQFRIDRHHRSTKRPTAMPPKIAARA